MFTAMISEKNDTRKNNEMESHWGNLKNMNEKGQLIHRVGGNTTYKHIIESDD